MREDVIASMTLAMVDASVSAEEKFTATPEESVEAARRCYLLAQQALASVATAGSLARKSQGIA